MTRFLKTASMALAVSGLTLAAPATSAVTVHAAPQAQAASYGAPLDLDQTFEHKKKRHKHWKRGRGHGHGHNAHRGRYDDRRYVQPRRGYNQSRPYYMNYDRGWGQPVRRDTRVWRGNDNRYYCRKDDGTTGLLVGAGVGALLGHEVAGRGDRTLGAILGGAAGALLGRSIDRSSTRCG